MLRNNPTIFSELFTPLNFRSIFYFLSDKCEVDPSYKESSSSLYQAYRNYSLDCNEYVRSTADFYFALEKAGFERVTMSRKRYFKGLRLREDTGVDEDFMN